MRWLAIVSCLALAACTPEPAAQDTSMVLPGAEWEEASPDSQGVDPPKLAAAAEYLREN